MDQTAPAPLIRRSASQAERAKSADALRLPFSQHHRFPCGSSDFQRMPRHIPLSTQGAFPKCRVSRAASNNQAAGGSIPSTYPKNLNVLSDTPHEYDSISSHQSPPPGELRHYRNGLRPFGNAYPTFQERQYRHYGNELSILWEQDRTTDSCFSCDSHCKSSRLTL